MKPGVLAGLDEVLDEIRIAGVEPGPHPRQVRPLRQAVHREHAVETSREDRRGLGCELDVALVARDDDAARRGPTPPIARKRAASATDPVGLPGSFTQSTSARSASSAETRSRSRCQAGVERAPAPRGSRRASAPIS